jgi:hypothetical protein
LPLIEFQLEDGISDLDALKLIHSSNHEKKSIENQDPSQNVNTLILDEESQDQSIDPFTYKLINEVISQLLYLYDSCSFL